MNKENEYISEKLRGLRAENNLTFEEVAEKLGIHRETFRKYEKNPIQMDIGIFLEVLEMYGTNPIIFFTQVYGKMPKNLR